MDRASSLLLGLSWGLATLTSWSQEHTLPLNTDADLRAAAPPALAPTRMPNMQHIYDEFIANKEMAIALGKALFWDQAVGSDGQACASCHFHAGADSRSKNQLSPGLNAGDQTFDVTLSGGGGPNYQLVAADFGGTGVAKEFNDVASSQGVHNRSFLDVQLGDDEDICTVLPDIFHVNQINTRRVEPRNTPTVINAVFNHRNFWDGRANNLFNGVNPLGRRGNVDPNVGVWKVEPGDVYATKRQVEIHNSSLASQAVGPTLSEFEMSCAGRTFPLVGRKLLGRNALAAQKVHPKDSVFSNVAPYGDLRAGLGLKFDYATMVRIAFKPEWWSGIGSAYDGFTHMEANFSLYWGIAIQLYEATLVSDQTPYDAFARGDNSALTKRQKDGLRAFLRNGRCINCHVGPEFTAATVAERALRPDGGGEGMERMIMGDLGVAVYDGGFYNIGVRGTHQDLCVGGELAGFPLSYSRQAATGNMIDYEAGAVAAGGAFPGENIGPVLSGERAAVDGACKVPTLRNVELTAPYFHNGAAATLKQVVQMYGDGFRTLFSQDNIDDLDPDILTIELTASEVNDLAAFLLSLTDERVRFHRAPFDHPELRIANGHPGDQNATADTDGDNRADDDFITIPAAGADGLLAPLANFLEAASTPSSGKPPRSRSGK